MIRELRSGELYSVFKLTKDRKVGFPIRKKVRSQF